MYEASPYSGREALSIIESSPPNNPKRQKLRAISICPDYKNPDAKPEIAKINHLLENLPEPLSIELVEIDYNSHLTQMPEIGHFKKLKYAHIAGRKIKSYDCLFPMTELHSLFLVNYKKSDLNDFFTLALSRFRAIRGKIERFDIVTKFAFFQGCSKLTSLTGSTVENVILDSCNQVDLSTIGDVKGLNNLQLLGCKCVNSLDFLLKCKDLQSLTITATPLSNIDFTSIKSSSRIRNVFLSVRNSIIQEIARENPRLIVTNGDVYYKNGVRDDTDFYDG